MRFLRKSTYVIAGLLLCLSFLCLPNLVLAATISTVSPAWNFEDHTVDHADFTKLSDSQIISEITTMNALFQAHGLPAPQHLAYPEGIYNSHVMSIVAQYRLTGRSACFGQFPLPYPLPSWYNLSAVAIATITTADQIKALIDQVIQQKGMMIAYTHGVSPTAECRPETLAAILDYAVAQQNAGKLSILTIRQAYTQFNGTKAVAVFSFDDGWSTDYSTVWPMFKARGIAGTSFIVGAIANANVPNRLNWAMITEMTQNNTNPTTPSRSTPNINPNIDISRFLLNLFPT